MNPPNVISLFDYVKKASAEKSAHIDKSSLKMKQLSLPFQKVHSLLMLMSKDFGSSDDFLRFSAATLPMLILDMRVAPRLDFIGSNRSHSFNVLKSLGIEYKDMLGRLDISSYEDSGEKYDSLWVSLIETLDAVQVSAHPVLLFFDDASFRSLSNRRLSHLYEIALLDTHAVEEISLSEQLRM